MANDASILFLNHSASRNGASILLLDLVKWLRIRSTVQPTLMSFGRGPLETEFQDAVSTIRWRSPSRLLGQTPFSQVSRISRNLDVGTLKWLAKTRRLDLIYANTAATWPQVQALLQMRIPVLWHIHELPYALALSLRGANALGLMSRVDRFVAVSAPVVDALHGEYGVPREKIDLVHGFARAPIRTKTVSAQIRAELMSQFGWPLDAFVVGGCGGLGWRKGTDLFLQVARACASADGGTAMRFVWIGGDAADSEALQFQHDLRKLGLESVCQHVPSTADVSNYYCAMDTFALTSREDPFPLVMLEAGAAGVPTVCFAESGGGPEFVGDDAGVVVPYLDVAAFVAALQRLHRAPAMRRMQGEAARRRVLTQYGVEAQAPKLLASIERCLAAR